MVFCTSFRCTDLQDQNGYLKRHELKTLSQWIPHIQNINAKWNKLSLGSKLPTCRLNDSIEVSILKLRCSSIINHIIYFLSKAAVFEYWTNVYTFLCQTFDFVFKHCTVGLSGSFVRKRSILGFLLNPFRTEQFLPFRSCKINEQFYLCKHSVCVQHCICPIWRCYANVIFFFKSCSMCIHSVLKGLFLQTVHL